MDVNKISSCTNEQAKKDNFGDASLCLDYFGYGGSKNAGLGSSKCNPGDNIIASNTSDDGCRLVLGLGSTSGFYSDNSCPLGDSKSQGVARLGNKRLLSEGDSILNLCLSRSDEKVCSVFEYSVLTQNHLNVPLERNRSVVPVADEGSTSAKKSGGYMPSLLLAPRRDSGEVLLQTRDFLESGNKYDNHPELSHEPCAITDYSMSSIFEPTSKGPSPDNRAGNSKKCKFWGCTKGARGATGHCIGHGGGQRCQKPGCNKGAESRTAYCKAHGGGRRCEHLGCTKSAEGRTDYCISHGGGRRCGYPGGCTKAARGKSGLCIKHGGGKRCKIEGCTRSAEGQIGLCISHGGGRRCQFQGCPKGAQGSTLFCKAHGGGKRCIFAGCTKGAEGSTPLCKGHGGGKRCLFDGGGICPKSVHGGTSFCVAHGGGKRCVVPGCTKSARGRTDCCVRHGGGKRCKVENCGKSAQGSTDFCKAHGGGKRCSWNEAKCEKFARGKNGLCAAHSSMAQGRETNRGMIAPGLFHGLVPTSSTVASSFEISHSVSGVSVVSGSTDSQERPPKRQHLIPPQVLVPLSMKCPSSYSGPLNYEKQNEGSHGCGFVSSEGTKHELLIPEGRVHGGGLLSLLGGDLKNYIDGM